MTILLLLTAVALPMARVQVQREREVELRRGLRDLRQAINSRLSVVSSQLSVNAILSLRTGLD